MNFNGSNKEDKTQDVLDNYDFTIVKFDVFSLYRDNKKNIKNIRNIIEYKLLVQDNRICIDYKIKFKQIYANYKTTRSHEKKYSDRSNNFTCQVRKDFLKKLGKSHCFSENRKDKDYFLITDKNKLSEINNYLSSIELKKITFQNIEYILTGCSPKGQGNGRGTLELKYDDEYLPFGFFLKSINKTKKIYKLYDVKEEEISWQRIWKKSEDKIISFEDFLSKNGKLQDLFIKFRDNPKNWKNISEECKKYFSEQTNNLMIENEITQYRIKGKKNFEKEYGSNRVNAIKKIFEISDITKIKLIESTIEYAHIYPVSAIKRSILKLDKSQKEERNYLFEMISNKDNFLPLDAETHILYDRNKLFWDQDGKLNKSSTLENNEYYEDKLYIYSKISNKILNTTNIKTYLTKFIELKNKQ